MTVRDSVKIGVKPTTGSIGKYLKNKIDNISSIKKIEHVRLAPDIHSLSLIKWADVVMCTTSSICVEVLLNGKIFLYPKYLHENTMLFEEMGACWTINSYAELENALQKIAQYPNFRPYQDRDVDAFITEVVYGGLKSRDVLGDYKNAILASVQK